MIATLRAWVTRLAGGCRAGRRDSDLAEELQQHLELTADNACGRDSPPADRDRVRAARLQLGGMAQAMEALRDQRGVPWLQAVKRDLRDTYRVVRRSPGFVTAAMVTLAVVTATNAAVFSVVYAVLLKPLPLRDPERLVVAWEMNPARSQAVVELSYRNFEAWRESSRTLGSVAVFGSSAWPLVLAPDEAPVRVSSVGVSTAFFDTLESTPLLGRYFQRDDEHPGPLPPLVLSHRVWRNHFGGDPAVVGSTIRTGDGRARVIGVAPPDLDFPRGVDLWLPINPVLAAVTGLDGFRDVGVLFVLARLRDGVSQAAAAADLERVAADDERRGGRRFGTAVRLTSFLDYQLGPVRSALWWLWSAVGVLLLVACGNIAALMLARLAQRRREVFVRRSLGATVAGLSRVLLFESLLVSLAGGLAGVLLAQWLLAAIVALAPDDVPRLGEASVRVVVWLFTFGLMAVTALVIATAPIVQLRIATLLVPAKNEMWDGAGRRSPVLRELLLGAQVALTLLLLTTAGLVLRSHSNVTGLDLGFVPQDVSTFEVDALLPGPATHEWTRDLISRVEGLDGVEAAGAVNVRPLALGAIGADTPVVLEGQPNRQESGALNPLVNYLAATPGYFAAMRLTVIKGRVFDAGDHAGASKVVVVGASTARRLWPGADPIGKRLSLPAYSDGEPAESWRTVVGVVGDVRYRGLDDLRLDVYEPAAQSTAGVGTFVVRSSRSPVAIAAMVKAEAGRMAPRSIVEGVTSMEAVVGRATATWRLSMWMFGLLATVATALVGVGLFSTVSFETARHTRDFAVRIALGAGAGTIVRTAMGPWRRCLLIGVAAGLLLAALGSRAVSRLLFGISALDAVTYVAVTCLTAAIMALGCLVPLYRTTRIESAAALRLD